MTDKIAKDAQPKASPSSPAKKPLDIKHFPTVTSSGSLVWSVRDVLLSRKQNK